MSTVTVSTPVRKYHLRTGSHVSYRGGTNPVNIEPGGILETTQDMIKLEGADRWELLEDLGGGAESLEDLKARIRILEGQLGKPEEPKEDDPDPDDLNRKSIKQLREMAASLDPPVDLSTCSNKEQMVNAIRGALDAA